MNTGKNTYREKGDPGFFFGSAIGETREKRAELNFYYVKDNHLGSINVVVSDRKLGVDIGNNGTIDYYTADVVSATDMYSGGMIMPGRSFNQNSYRYGNNSQEKDNEIFNGAYTAEFWEYDSRSLRRWNRDPINKPWESPYATFSNNPILNSDVKGNTDDPANNSSKNDQANSNGYQSSKGGTSAFNNETGEAFGDGAGSAPTSTEPVNLPTITHPASFFSLSDKGKDFIQSWEKGPNGGAALTPYDDANPQSAYTSGDPVAGYLTIGWGHKITAGENYDNGITAQQAEDIFSTDVQTKAINPIISKVTAYLTQKQFDALVSYVFNVGEGNSLVGTQLIQKLNNSDYPGAASEMDIVTSGGVLSPGLQLRRPAERNIFNNGTYVNHQ